jgi:hypothetical protein
MTTNTTTAAARQVQALLADSTGNADRLKRSVEVLADTLAARMAEIHGRDYRINIDHTPGIEFVVVVPNLRPEKRTAPPKAGEAA